MFWLFGIVTSRRESLLVEALTAVRMDDAPVVTKQENILSTEIAEE